MREQSGIPPSAVQTADLRLIVRPYMQVAMSLLLGLGLLGGWAGSAWLTVLLIFGVLIISNVWIGRKSGTGGRRDLPVLASAAINLTALTVIVLLTGGAYSPFWLLFLIGAIASAMSFRGKAGQRMEWLNTGVAAVTLLAAELVQRPPDRGALTLAGMEVLTIFFASIMIRKISALFLESGEKLQESEERLGRFIENALDVVFTVSTAGIITSLNAAFEALTGWPRSEWVGRSYDEIVIEEDRPRALDQFGRMLRGATLRAVRVRLRARHGEPPMVEMSISPYIREGRVAGLLVIARDVTEEQQAQNALAASERRFRALVEHGADHILLIDPDGRLQSANPTHEHLLGYAPDAFLRLNLFELLHPEDLTRARRSWLQVRRKPGLSRDDQFRLRHADGSWRWIEGTATNLLKEPAVGAIVINFRDVTQRRLAEQAVIESEDRYRRLVEHSPYGVVIHIQGKVAYVNPAATRLIGAESAEQLAGAAVLDFVHPESRAAVAKRLSEMAEGQDAPPFEEKFVRLDGGVIDVEVTAYPFILQNQAAVEVVFHDITERKRTLARLREAESRYRELVEHLPAITYIAAMDEFKTRLYVSPQAERLVGLSTADSLTDPEIWRKRIHPGDRERVLAQAERFYIGEEPFVSEYRMLTREGRELWFHDEAVIVQSETTQDRFIHGIQFDITERKQAEAALQQAETRYRALVEQLPIVVYVNPASNIHSTVYISPQIEALLGFTQGEWLEDSESWAKALHPEDRPRVFAEVEQADQSGGPLNTEYRLLTRDDRIVWIRDQAVLIHGSDGQPLIWQGLMANITDEKQAQSLQEAAYAIAQAVVTTPAMDELYPEIHGALQRILPVENFFIALYDRENDLLSFPYFVDQYDPSSPPQKPGHGLTEYVLRTQMPLLATPEVFADLVGRGEVDLVGTDSYEWLGVPLKIKDQTIGVMVMQAYEEGIHFSRRHMDMAVYVSAQVAQAIERKQAEEALQRAHDELELRVQERTAELAQANSFLQAMMDNTPDHIYFKDIGGRFIRNSRSQAAMMGLKDPREVVGKTDFDFFPHAQRAFEDEQEVMRSGRPLVDYEERVVWPDERVTWVSTTKLPLRDQAGKAIGIFGISRDITRRKETEQALRKAKDELEAANRELDAFSYSVSHDLQAPLRAIDGYSRILAHEYAESLPEEAKVYLAHMRDSARRMGQLIQDLLKLSRLSRQVLKQERVDMSEIARTIASDLSKVASDRAVEFVIADNLAVNGDAGLLRVMMENLLNNAWKYTSRRESARIEFGSSPQPDGSKALFVRDNGVGFDMAYAGQLFGAFQRLHSDSEFEGTGIGLATVQRIIHRHGGRVWAEAEVDKGATFYFTLPEAPSLSADRFPEPASISG